MPVLKCNMAALALAKRGENIDRCFIGQLGGPKRARYQMYARAAPTTPHPPPHPLPTLSKPPSPPPRRTQPQAPPFRALHLPHVSV